MRPFVFKPNAKKKQPGRMFQDSPLPPVKRANGKPVTIRNFTNDECRWPYGGPSADMLLCGRKAERAPYCPEHRAVAYRRNPMDLSDARED